MLIRIDFTMHVSSEIFSLTLEEDVEIGMLGILDVVHSFLPLEAKAEVEDRVSGTVDQLVLKDSDM